MENGKSVVIAGGSGFLGNSLAQHLPNSKFKVRVLTRRTLKPNGSWSAVKWDGRSTGDWVRVMDGADAVVNLVGRSVDCIKTPEHCDEILRSRIESTRVLGQAMNAVFEMPRVWVQMSTAHIYGDPPSITCSEDSPFGYGLAPDVGKAWEAEFARSIHPEQRGVILRTSFVLGKDRGAGGGALSRLRSSYEMGAGRQNRFRTSGNELDS